MTTILIQIPAAEDACAECGGECDFWGESITTYYDATDEYFCDYCMKWEREPIGEMR